MLKDRYTTQEIFNIDPDKEKDKILVSIDTFALLDAKDELILELAKLRRIING